MDDKTYTKYVDYLTAALKPHLRKKINYEVHVYPSPDGGAIEFKLGEGFSNRVILETSSSSLNEVLKTVPQNLVAGNLDDVQLLGTNIFMEGNRILFFKDINSGWNKEDALKNAEQVIELSTGSSK